MFKVYLHAVFSVILGEAIISPTALCEIWSNCNPNSMMQMLLPRPRRQIRQIVCRKVSFPYSATGDNLDLLNLVLLYRGVLSIVIFIKATHITMSASCFF